MKYKDPKIVAGQTSQMVSSWNSKVALVTLALGLTLHICERTLKLRLKNPLVCLRPKHRSRTDPDLARAIMPLCMDEARV